jgi:hypothetical protein
MLAVGSSAADMSDHPLRSRPSGANGHRMSQFAEIQETLSDKLSDWFSTRPA